MSKERLTKNPFLLLIDGPSCSGKTSVASAITEKYGEIFNAKHDKIKWLISNYKSSNHRNIVYDITRSTIKTALENGLSVIKEGSFEPQKIIEIGKQLNVPVFVANIVAPKEVLEERFKKRIEKKKDDPEVKISNTSLERFNEKMYNKYLESKLDSPLEFDSSKQSPEEIAEKIIDYIKNNIN